MSGGRPTRNRAKVNYKEADYFVQMDESLGNYDPKHATHSSSKRRRTAPTPPIKLVYDHDGDSEMVSEEQDDREASEGKERVEDEAREREEADDGSKGSVGVKDMQVDEEMNDGQGDGEAEAASDAQEVADEHDAMEEDGGVDPKDVNPLPTPPRLTKHHSIPDTNGNATPPNEQQNETSPSPASKPPASKTNNMAKDGPKGKQKRNLRASTAINEPDPVKKLSSDTSSLPKETAYVTKSTKRNGVPLKIIPAEDPVVTPSQQPTEATQVQQTIPHSPPVTPPEDAVPDANGVAPKQRKPTKRSPANSAKSTTAKVPPRTKRKAPAAKQVVKQEAEEAASSLAEDDKEGPSGTASTNGADSDQVWAENPTSSEDERPQPKRAKATKKSLPSNKPTTSKAPSGSSSTGTLWDTHKLDLMFDAVKTCGEDWKKVAETVNMALGVTPAQCRRKFHDMQKQGKI
ncbi:hypothetical protein HK097_004662 [Rhizophlyctis rosea]|uniref:HTH myb-type domain-containing protein n=1 Tax=Rhizophlyctis rosea TaxID=64517 RepID=A0AAD5SLU7_9FUNG|nr:hypothetical protein HK097_004662 [Rhizophlyctis rosea]